MVRELTSVSRALKGRWPMLEETGLHMLVDLHQPRSYRYIYNHIQNKDIIFTSLWMGFIDQRKVTIFYND